MAQTPGFKARGGAWESGPRLCLQHWALTVLSGWEVELAATPRAGWAPPRDYHPRLQLALATVSSPSPGAL